MERLIRILLTVGLTTIIANYFVSCDSFSGGAGTFAGGLSGGSDGGKDGGSDGEDGEDGGSDSGSDSGNDSGGIDSGNDAGGNDSGGIDGNDSGVDGEDGDGDDADGLSVDEEVTRGLLQPMSISQVGKGDEASKVTVTNTETGKSGTIAFAEFEKGEKQLPEICRKHGPTKVQVVLAGEHKSYTIAAAKAEGNIQAFPNNNQVDITIDLDGCGIIGTCVEEDKDNKFVLKCPGDHPLEIEGL